MYIANSISSSSFNSNIPPVKLKNDEVDLNPTDRLITTSFNPSKLKTGSLYCQEALNDTYFSLPNGFKIQYPQRLEKNGTVTYYSDECEITCTYVNYKFHGPFILKFKNGSILELSFVNDKPLNSGKSTIPTGTSTYFKYKDEEREGEAIEVSQNNTQLRFTYVKGIRQGEAIWNNSQGVCYHFNYKNGILHGPVIGLLTNDERVYFSFNNGVAEGPALEQSPSYELEFTYENGKRQGPATFSSNDGSISNFSYNQDKREGKAHVRLSDGSIILFEYKSDVPHGPAKLLYPDGKILYFNYINGQIDGNALEELPDEYTLEFTLKEGLREGMALKSYASGFLDFLYYDKGYLKYSELALPALEYMKTDDYVPYFLGI